MNTGLNIKYKAYFTTTFLCFLGLSAACAIGCGGDGAQASGSDEGPDAGANVKDSGAQTSDASASAPPDAKTCVPKPGPDLPDDAFVDTNCDGIDGEVDQAVFVAPSGDDSAAGTLDAPVASLRKAVELAAFGNKAVYVCNATYSEPLLINDPVNVFGGYDCSNDWKRTNDRAWVAPPSGSALIIGDVDGAVTIERMGFRSSDVYAPGQSSIAAKIVRSSDVKLKLSMVEAGDGADGERGAQVSPVLKAAPDGEPGESLPTVSCNSRSIYVGGPCVSPGRGGRIAYVKDVCTQGGYGGDGGSLLGRVSRGDGKPGFPDGILGGLAMNGHAGGPGEPGTVGAASQQGIGSLDGDEYVPSNRGGDGGAGSRGQAAGGGAGGNSNCYRSGEFCNETFYVGGGGGQGGLGGCGGKGGKGGGGGGGSIGLLVVDSAVELVNCFVTTGDGGTGGVPSPGAAGQLGGSGGPGGRGTAPEGDGYAGGDGGNGGPGGSGGPGGGGPSIGLLYSGPEPTLSPSTVLDIGLGGDGGKGISGRDAVDGVTAETLSLSES